MSTRSQDSFRQAFSKSLTFDDIRLMDAGSLERSSFDPDSIARVRSRLYRNESKAVERLTVKTGDYDDMEKARDTRVAGTQMDCRDFALSDNLALKYFNIYGENYMGGNVPDSDSKWVCPRCQTKYLMDWKTLPMACRSCGTQTPVGRMIEDGVLRR